MRAQPEGGTSTKGILHKHGLTIVAWEPVLLSQQFALHCGVQGMYCASVSIINTAVEGTVYNIYPVPSCGFPDYTKLLMFCISSTREGNPLMLSDSRDTHTLSVYWRGEDTS